MKVAFLSLERFEGKDVGQGIPRYTVELHKQLKKLEKKSHVKVDKFLMKGSRFDYLSFKLGAGEHDLSGYDVVHNPIGFLPFKKKARKFSYVVTIHDTNPIGSTDIRWKLWRNHVFRPGIRLALKEADGILADTEQTKQEVVAMGYPKGKIKVVPLGVSDRFIKTPAKKTKHSSFKVGYLGTFNPNKNVGMLVGAANSVKDKNVVFELWGRGPMEEELKAMATSSRIKFMGFAPDEKIVSIYDSFDVFIWPSLYDGFGLPIVEAQARGLPVIVYKNGKISPEIKRHCFEAKDEEHLAELITEIKVNGYNAKSRKKAMDYARTFTWQRTARETLSFYKNVVGDNVG